jgi:flagellar basal-body rod modification protein FlgD
MAVESIGGILQGSGSVVNQAGLGQDDFLKILLTQLSFQDPLKPLDNQEFIAQMAQFTSLEFDRQSNEKIDSLLAFQSVSQAVGLIGKTVDVETSSGSQTGTVTTVTFENRAPQLAVLTTAGASLIGISLSQISQVR